MAQQLQWTLTPSCQQHECVHGHANGKQSCWEKGKGEYRISPPSLSPYPLPNMSSPPNAPGCDQHRAIAAHAGCSRDNPSPLVPGDIEHQGGCEVPTCVGQVPSADHAPSVSQRAVAALCKGSSLLCHKGWRKEGCLAAPTPAAKLAMQAHVPAVGP